MRKGRRLAVDAGRARVGLAISDQDGILATPLATVTRVEKLTDTVGLILDAIADFEVMEAYVGLPLNLQGKATPSTQDAVNLAHTLSALAQFQVRFVDERLTTVTAAAQLRSAGKNSKTSRGVIDQAAAVIILEQALAAEKLNSQPPGRSLEEFAAELEEGNDA